MNKIFLSTAAIFVSSGFAQSALIFGNLTQNTTSNTQITTTNSPIRITFNTGNAPVGGNGWSLTSASFITAQGGPILQTTTVPGMQYSILDAAAVSLGVSPDTTAEYTFSGTTTNVISFDGSTTLMPNTDYIFEIVSTTDSNGFILESAFNGTTPDAGSNPGASLVGTTIAGTNEVPQQFAIEADVVPEPTSTLLLGLASLAGLTRRKR